MQNAEGYSVIHTSKKDELDYLYSKSALTLEGFDASGFPDFAEWLKECNALTDKELTFYVTSGKVMNDMYGLTGDNAYPDDLNIVSADNIDLGKVIFPRFAIGGRWFDDIVDNNQRREKGGN